ncbi:DUF2971 domain-containing protein [Cellulosilyticum sp. I15G10I2]|uniref:DUF2971 domain-containing protein n=1 Tax=Cellulosilyticum sp. I15G10I2 TaxID=1892843 RepID=UPI00085C6148|nr:DUF2971 domain-containing protein [Cellulosilyticum sp. I15G10I2]
MDKFYVWLDEFRKQYSWICQNYVLDQDLYHYTSISALDSILKNNSLWLTQIEYMNDYEEMIYAIQLIKECLEEIDTQYIKEYILSLCEDIENGKKYGAVFILSLSYDQDSVSLWNNYGKDGGYNIHLSKDFWKDALDGHLSDNVALNKNQKEPFNATYSYMFRKVIYNSQEQRQRILTYLMGIKELENRKEDPEVATNIRLLSYHLIDEVCFFKRQGHSVEQEFRLMISFMSPEYEKAFVKHRQFNGSFVPYIELKLKKPYFDTITIGPRHNLDFVEKGLKSYLKCADKQIEVYRSTLKLRF